MKKGNNTMLYVGIGLLAFCGVAIASSSKPKQEEPSLDEPPGNTGIVPPVPINLKLLLKKGSSGQEVAKLQGYLGIVNDGVFGPMTEAALFKLKGVRETTLEKFVKLPTVNQSRIGSGSRVMSNNPAGANLYKAIQKADKSYYKDASVTYTVGYGKEIGIVRSSTPLGNWYLIEWYGGYMRFVKATDVKKI